MAYKGYLTAMVFDEFEHFWALHRGVGWGYENNYDDVMLVQYLINSLEITKRLKEDGIFGPKTSGAIWYFQRWYNRNISNCVLVDGKIDAARGDVINAPVSETEYTIYSLNMSYMNKKRSYYRDIKMDPELPNPLNHLLWATEG